MNRQTPMLPEDDVRETPPELFTPLHEEFHFTLDACATPDNAKCMRYFTEVGLFDESHPECPLRIPDVDGLSGSWRDARVWCNPPFSQIAAWVEKAWTSGAELVVMLVPATRTEQSWWQDYVEPFRDGRPTRLDIGNAWGSLRTRFIRKRTRFLKDGKPMGSPKFGCVLLIWDRKPPGE